MFFGRACRLVYRVSFKKVCQSLSQIEETGSTKEKQRLLQSLLKQSNMSEVRSIINFINCEPDQDVKAHTADIQVEDQTIYAALKRQFLGAKFPSRLDDRNLGHLNYNFDETKNSVELEEIYTLINQLRVPVGNGSELEKQEIVESIFKLCANKDEFKFIIRFLQKKMRIGLKSRSIEGILEEMGQEYSELGLKILGFSTHLSPRLGVPIQFQLAKGYADEDELIKHLSKEEGHYYIEPKYDGERIQIHYDGSSCELFSRMMEKRGWKYPTLKEKLMNYFADLGLKNIILDSEMICFDGNNKIVNFQEQMSLKITEAKLAVVVFDILQLNDQPLVQKKYTERVKVLQEILRENEGVRLIQRTELQNTDQIKQIYEECLKNKYEGIMIKNDQPYNPGSRVGWYKLKPHNDMDLVVVGANYGQGKRSNYFGSFLMAIRGNDVFYPIARIGTGFDQKELQRFTEEFSALSTPTQPKNVYNALPSNLRPDVWISPKTVWEVQYDSISQSPVYLIPEVSQAVEGYQGISLRFIRFVRERPDKDASNATLIDEAIAQLRRRIGILKQN